MEGGVFGEINFAHSADAKRLNDCVTAEGLSAEIAAVAAEDWDTCRALKAPIQRVCTAAVPIPYSPPMEDFVLPDQARIEAAIRAAVAS